jgi:pre-mRNA-splicing factor RBM22/SLT11
MLDLQYGLPVQVRDSVLGVQEHVPKNEANREYFLATNASRLARGDASLLNYDSIASPAAKEALEKLAAKRPRSDKNLAPPCSFYAKGKCTRGDTCPYRHVLVAERYPSLQSYRDRYHGENDPDAEKIFELNPHLPKTAVSSKTLASEKVIQTLFVQGIRLGLTEDDIKEFFAARAAVTKIQLVADGTAALVMFGSKKDADTAASEALGTSDIRGIPVKVSWAKDNLDGDPDVEEL